MDGDDTALVVQPQTVDNRDIMLRPIIEPKLYLQRKNEIQNLLREVFELNVDYGKIEGIDKPMIFKPGIEKLLEFYGLGHRLTVVKEIEDWEGGFFSYRVKCTVFFLRNGMTLTEGLGAANSNETKYAARWVFPNELPKGTDLSKLETREYARRDGSGTFIKYLWKNEKIADQQNTIMKMAGIRALRDAALKGTSSSGLFTEEGLNDWIEVGYQVNGENKTGTLQQKAPAARSAQQGKAKPMPRQTTKEVTGSDEYEHPGDDKRPAKVSPGTWERWCETYKRRPAGLKVPHTPFEEMWMESRIKWLTGKIDEAAQKEAQGVPS